MDAKARFDFQHLDVYRAALAFLNFRFKLLLRLPPGHGDLADQLTRASTSILLNIAEGSGEFSQADRARFYRMARRSAAECAAILDAMDEQGLKSQEQLEEGRVLLDRIMAMVTAMCRSLSTSAKRKPRPARH
jgi:four helix bundle protein